MGVTVMKMMTIIAIKESKMKKLIIATGLALVVLICKMN